MTERVKTWVLAAAILCMPALAGAQGPIAAAAPANPHLITYQGTSGPGAGKHIVFIAKKTLPFFRQSLLSHGKRGKNRSIIEIAFS